MNVIEIRRGNSMEQEKRTVVFKGRQCGYSAAQIQSLKEALYPNHINRLVDVTPQRVAERKERDWRPSRCPQADWNLIILKMMSE